jgi:hypothetical protein
VLVLDAQSAPQRRLAGVVRTLDWLARFRVEWGRGGDPVTVVDRDGRVLEGGPAVWLALSRLPVTAFFALPILLFVRTRQRVLPAGGAL